ncbi:MAG: hypothetical protein AB8B50_01215 [Pirellulaceae bacterium]
MGQANQRTLHESTSRFACRLTFVGVGFLPLLACLALCVFQWTPFYESALRRYWQATLSQELGCPVAIARVDLLSPWKCRLFDVRLQHPESGVDLARADLVDQTFSEGQRTLRLYQAELLTKSGTSGQRLRLDWNLLHNAFLCRPTKTRPRIEVICDRVRIDRYALDSVAMGVVSNAESTQLNLLFQLADPLRPKLGKLGAESRMKMPSPKIRLAIQRQHSAPKQETRGALRVLAGSMPISVFSKFVPELAVFGESAKIRGAFAFGVSGSGDWELTVGETSNILQKPDRESEATWTAQQVTTGSALGNELWLHEIDLGTLCWQSPIDFTGRGEMQIRQLVWSHGRLQNVDFLFQARDGVVSQRALQVAASYLNIGLATELHSASSESIGFQSMKLDARLDTKLAGLSLRHALVEGRSGPLALRDYRNSVPHTTPFSHLVSMLDFMERSIAGAPANGGVYSKWVANLVRWLPLESGPPPKVAGALEASSTSQVQRPNSRASRLSSTSGQNY